MASRRTHESHDGTKLGSKLVVLCVKGPKRDQRGGKKDVKREQRGCKKVVKRCLGRGKLRPGGGLEGVR